MCWIYPCWEYGNRFKVRHIIYNDNYRPGAGFDNCLIKFSMFSLIIEKTGDLPFQDWLTGTRYQYAISSWTRAGQKIFFQRNGQFGAAWRNRHRWRSKYLSLEGHRDWKNSNEEKNYNQGNIQCIIIKCKTDYVVMWPLCSEIIQYIYEPFIKHGPSFQ